jgi:hypothetical protein
MLDLAEKACKGQTAYLVCPERQRRRIMFYDIGTRAMLASIGYFVYDLWAMFRVHRVKVQDWQSKKI